MLDHTNPNVEKTHCIDAELTGPVLKLDMKLQSLCVSSFSLFVVRILVKSYHFGVNWPTTLCKNKDGVRFFTLNFECHSSYNKLLLCNSEDGDIACCNKTIDNGIFVFFLKNKNLFLFIKKQKTD